ncbi:MAG: AAA family ATPase [Smithella sp.]
MERTVKEYIFDQEMNAGEMIFLTGPRQVGKTTFARNWLAGQKADDLYFNWDDPAVAADYKRNPLYFTNIIKEDIRDLSRIADIKGIGQLIELLPSKVGSLLSVNSIVEDTGSHHATITRWLDILKAIYLNKQGRALFRQTAIITLLSGRTPLSESGSFPR